MPRRERLYVYLAPKVLADLKRLSGDYGMTKSGMASMFIASGMRVFVESKRREVEEDLEAWKDAIDQAEELAA